MSETKYIINASNQEIDGDFSVTGKVNIGELEFPDGSIQTTAYVTSEPASYKGFRASYGRMYDAEPTLSKIVIYKDSVNPSSTIDGSTEDDDFQVTGLVGSDIVALFVIMGEDDTNPTSLEILKAFAETIIDNVILDGGIEGDFNSINTMKTAFYDNYNTIAAQAGGLYVNFEFYKENFEVNGPTTLQVGSGLELSIANDGNGTYSLNSVIAGGINYKPGHKVLISGDLLSGVTGVNDCIFTVSVITDGLVTDGAVTGVAAGGAQDYHIINVTNYELGSGFQVTELQRSFNGSASINSWNNGSGYVVGDTFKILGSDIVSSSSPDNDVTVIIQAVDGGGSINQFTVTGTLPEVMNENFISDGGRDQYDGGNYINTNLGSEISYNQGDVVEESSAFDGGNYVVVYQNSIFGILATEANIEFISTSGESGFDGDGQADTGSLYGSTGTFIPVTYDQLYTLWDAQSLDPGSYYLMIDYATCYDQPNYDSSGNEITSGNFKTGSEEPLLLLATSTSGFAPTVYSALYPKDKITYDISWNLTEVTENPAKGRITERIDERNNRTDYDFRGVQFVRYQGYFSEDTYQGKVSLDSDGNVTGVGTLFTNQWTVGDIIGIKQNSDNNSISCFDYYEVDSIADDLNMVVIGTTIRAVNNTYYSNGRLLSNYMNPHQCNVPGTNGSAQYYTFNNNDSYNTYIGNKSSNGGFILSNNVFLGGTYRDNYFGGNCIGNTFNDNCDSNTIGAGFQFNIIPNDFDENTIGTDFQRNIIDCDFERNTISDEFNRNMIGDDDGTQFDGNVIGVGFSNNFITMSNQFTDNSIGNNFNNNVIDDSFEDNQISGDFSSNLITDNFQDNKIDRFFDNNTLLNEFEYNTVGTSFQSNIIEGNVNYNTFGNSCNGNTFDSNAYSNKIGDDFSNNTIGAEFTSNVIGNNFYNNDIYLSFLQNVIGPYVNQNGFGNSLNPGNYYFSRNTVSGNMNNNFFLGNAELNNIGHYFVANTIGNNFQLNDIKASIDNTEFTENLGNIVTVGYTPVSGTDGTYEGISPSQWSGLGIDAVFTITVSGNAVSDVSVSNSGKRYQVGDTITLSAVSFGGPEPLVLTVTGISETPMVYLEGNTTIQKDLNGGALMLSAIVNGGVYIDANITRAID